MLLTAACVLNIRIMQNDSLNAKLVLCTETITTLLRTANIQNLYCQFTTKMFRFVSRDWIRTHNLFEPEIVFSTSCFPKKISLKTVTLIFNLILYFCMKTVDYATAGVRKSAGLIIWQETVLSTEVVHSIVLLSTYHTKFFRQ